MSICSSSWAISNLYWPAAARAALTWISLGEGELRSEARSPGRLGFRLLLDTPFERPEESQDVPFLRRCQVKGTEFRIERGIFLPTAVVVFDDFRKC